MTNSQRTKCNAIIHSTSAVAAGIGAGLAQLPCGDSVAIVPAQTAMAVGLAKTFGLELSDGAAKAAVATAVATTTGRAASQVLIGWIPGLGNIVNAATAATVTESVGWILANEFEKQAERRLNG